MGIATELLGQNVSPSNSYSTDSILPSIFEGFVLAMDSSLNLIERKN